MSEVVKFLNDNPVVYLATVGTDGKAKCRPMLFCMEHDDKIWFCTDNRKNVYKDMQQNPNIQISVTSAINVWIRLSCKAVFENNITVKEYSLQNPVVKALYGDATNPAFESFYLSEGEAVISDFSGNPPIRFSI